MNLNSYAERTEPNMNETKLNWNESESKWMIEAWKVSENASCFDLN